MRSPAVAIALGAGVLGGVQPKINARLGDRLDSSVLASLVNFTAALAVVVLVLSVRRDTRRLLWRVPSWPVPGWTSTAGLGGAVVVLSGAVAVDTIGVAVFSVAFFGGQIAASVVVDRFGIGPGGMRPMRGRRVAAAGIAILAVVVAQLGRSIGELEPALVAFVVVAGTASALQAAFNARIGHAVDDAFAATALNVAVGTVALGTVVAVLVATGGLDAPVWPPEPWLYAGGVLGVTIVLSLAIAAAALGVLRATLAMLAAQLTTAFVVDWIVENDRPTAGAIAGAALTVVAVVLVRSGAAATPAR